MCFVYFLDTAQQQAAMFFRSEPNWELQENMKGIGNYFHS